MSRLYGSVRQIAFVVHSLDRALAYWTQTLGVGPFFVQRETAPENFRYRGNPSPPPLLSIALGSSGGLQVELIEQLDQRPSAYKEFLDVGREGFHHVCSWLTRAEYDVTIARLGSYGATVAHEGTIGSGGVRFAYIATDVGPDGLMYEIADVMDSPAYPALQALLDAGRAWDGREPIREIRL